jgi:hypothetical protein
LLKVRLIQYCSLILFFAYWISTFIYNSPNNFVRIQLFDEILIFEQFFYQKWTFFSPPGHENHRVYFEYTDRKDSTKRFTLEILQKLFETQKRKAPFNMEEELIGDFISNSTIEINNAIADNYKIIQSNLPDSTKEFCFGLAYNSFVNLGKSYPAVKTLYNYGKTLSKSSLRKPSDYKLRILIVLKPIPRFKDRFAKDDSLKNPVRLIYKSHYYDL